MQQETGTITTAIPASQPARAADHRIKALRRFALSITVFNLAGHLFLGFEQAYLTPVVGVLTAYTVSLLLEALDARLSGKSPRYRGSVVSLVDFLLPAHIAGLACAMLLYGNDQLLVTVFAVTVAVSGKYVIRVPVNGTLRHLFNPSNLGITVTLLCFSWVAIAPPYHFTELVGDPVDWLLVAAILAAGTMLNATLTRRIPLVLGWLGGFVLQAVLRAVFFDHALTSALLTMAGVAFVLFTLYMITDPGTTPSTPRHQVIFGLSTGLVYGGLVLVHVAFGLFFALTIVCAGRLLLMLARQAWRAGRPALGRPPAEPTAVVVAAEPVPAGVAGGGAVVAGGGAGVAGGGAGVAGGGAGVAGGGAGVARRAVRTGGRRPEPSDG